MKYLASVKPQRREIAVMEWSVSRRSCLARSSRTRVSSALGVRPSSRLKLRVSVLRETVACGRAPDRDRTPATFPSAGQHVGYVGSWQFSILSRDFHLVTNYWMIILNNWIDFPQRHLQNIGLPHKRLQERTWK